MGEVLWPPLRRPALPTLARGRENEEDGVSQMQKRIRYSPRRFCFAVGHRSFSLKADRKRKLRPSKKPIVGLFGEGL